MTYPIHLIQVISSIHTNKLYYSLSNLFLLYLLQDMDVDAAGDGAALGTVTEPEGP